MNTIRDNELAMPSGYEVESATIVTPVEAGITVPSLGNSNLSSGTCTHQATFRDALDNLRTKGVEQLNDLKSRGSQQLETLKMRGSVKLHELQHQLRDQSEIAKTSLRTNLDRQVTTMNSSMRTNPMKWVGIAAGAGFGIGLIGRFMHWKNYHRRATPQLVIIEASC